MVLPAGGIVFRTSSSVEHGQIRLGSIVRVRLTTVFGLNLVHDPPAPEARAASVGTAARHQLQRLFPDASVRTAQVLRPARGTGPGRHAFPPCSLWLDPAASCAEHVRRFQEAVSTQPNPDGHEQMVLGRWYGPVLGTSAGSTLGSVQPSAGTMAELRRGSSCPSGAIGCGANIAPLDSVSSVCTERNCERRIESHLHMRAADRVHEATVDVPHLVRRLGNGPERMQSYCRTCAGPFLDVADPVVGAPTETRVIVLGVTLAKAGWAGPVTENDTTLLYAS